MDMDRRCGRRGRRLQALVPWTADVFTEPGLRQVIEQFPEQNPNPVLRLSASGEVMYTNPAARALAERLGEPEYGDKEWPEELGLEPNERSAWRKVVGIGVYDHGVMRATCAGASPAASS